MTDGSITFSTELDNKELEKQLAGVSKKIDRIQDKIGQQKAERMPLVEQSRKLAVALDVANSKLESMRNNSSFSAVAIKTQEDTVKGLQSRWGTVQTRVERYDNAIANATIELNRSKDKAGALHRELAGATKETARTEKSVKKSTKNLERFRSRLREIVSGALVFTVMSQGLASIREWVGKVIKSNDKAQASIAKLKGALLTLVQPLIEVAIPAFTTFVNLLTSVTNQISKFVSVAFGTTAEKSAEAAKSLYEQTEALDDTRKAAKKAAKTLASFDEVNKLGDKDEKNDASDKIAPDFSGAGQNNNWLKERLGESAQMVTDALLLGGIALVAIGAAMGSLPLVLAGLGLIAAGFFVGGETQTLQKWVDALRLNNVQEFLLVALSLGGIALVAIGAATKNIFTILSGLMLLNQVISYTEKSGMMEDWRKSLGIDAAPSYITAGLLLGGIALIAIGAATKNILMVISGIGLLKAGFDIGTKSGTFKKWAEALGLDTVFEQLVAAAMLAGIVFIAIGASTGNVLMVIAGCVLALGSAFADTVGEKTLKEWWEVLKLTSVQQWVSVALMLVGIVFVAIGAMSKNLLMVIGGAALIGFGSLVATQNNNLKDWVTALGLEKVAGWAAVALSLAGIAMLAIGAAIKNIKLVIAGIALLGAGVVVGTQSGALKKWWETLNLSEVAGKVEAALLLGGIALVAIGAATGNVAFVLMGLGLLGEGVAVGSMNRSSKSSSGFSGGGSGGSRGSSSRAMPQMASMNIPALANGAVIPPNREFIAKLGDQTAGNNLEGPESLFRQIVREESGGRRGGQPITVVLEMDKREFGRAVYETNEETTQYVGMRLARG